MKKLITILVVICLLPVLSYEQEKDTENAILIDDMVMKKDVSTVKNSLMKQSNKTISSYTIKNISANPPVMSPDATTIINPAGDGGFETGTTFNDNGWTEVQGNRNKWYVSTLYPPGPTQGTRCAITGTSATNWSGQNFVLGVNHIYRDFTVPAAESKIKLTFKFINQNADPGYDYLSVHVVPTSTTPTAGNLLSTGQTLVLTNAQTTYGTVTVFLDPSYAGTTQRLVFSWRTDFWPPTASIGIDEISLVSSSMSTITSTATGGDWGQGSSWIGGIVPDGDNVIIDGSVNVETDYYCNDLTVNSGKTLTIADIASLGLFVKGNGTINGNVNIGGINGGAIVFNFGTTGKIFSVNNGAIININYLLNIYYGALSITSGGEVNIGTSGQLYLQGAALSTIASGGSLVNNNNGALYYGLIVRYTGSSLIVNGSLTSNNGNFLFFSSSINTTIDYGTLFFNQGNFSSPDGTNYYGFSYNTSVSTLVYGGSANYNTSTLEYSSSGPYNLSVNMNSGNTVTLNVARTVNGTLSLINGTLSNGSNLTLGNNATINRSNGALSSVPTFGANCNVIYSNTTPITTGPELPVSTGTVLNNLTFDGSSTVTLSAYATVKGTATLTMTSGIVNTGSYTLMLGTSPAARGNYVSGSARIVTGATGGFKRWFAASTINGVEFPVGSTTSNNLITLSFTGAPSAGSLTAKFIASNPGSALMEFLYDIGINPEPNPYLIDCYSQRGYWQLDAGDGLSGGTYNISLRGEGFNPTGSEITNYSELRVLKRTNGGSNWEIQPTHAPATGSNTIPVIQRAGLTTFSQFGMGGNWGRGNPLEGPLPVKLATFNSVITGRDVKLNWVTEMEENNEGFEVQNTEYRTQNLEWKKVGFVKGNGTKSNATSYSYEDRNLQSGKYKYRLKQIDYNGNYEYFELAGIVEIGVPAKFDLSQNYPNPFNPVTKINFDIPESGLVTLKVYDILGREAATIMNEMKDAGYYTITFDASKLSSGVYFYRLTSKGFSNVKRLVVLK